VVDVGGGFPSIYPGMIPPALADYMDSIHRGFAEMMVHETTELWCEPGRALVAESSSMLVKVELKKGDALYLNDGSYGTLFDAAHTKWPFPVKLVRPESNKGGEASSEMKAVPLLRPDLRLHRPHGPAPSTCRPMWPRATTSRFGMLGAYGVAMNTRFNGFRRQRHRDSCRTRRWRRPTVSRPASWPRPRAEDEDARKVVRFSRPKGKAGPAQAPSLILIANR